MPTVALTNPDDFRTITSLYLYGQATPPVRFEDRLRDAGAPQITVNVDPSFWSGTGPGRYAFAAMTMNSFVKSFFTNALSPAVQQLYTSLYATQGGGDVSITVGQLKTLLGLSNSAFSFSFAQYGFGTGDSDYAARTYIYNNETFSLSDSTTFVFSTDPTQNHIANLQLQAAQDNFDFTSISASLAQIGNETVLQPAIDPDKIGQQLLLNIPNSPTINVSPSDFAALSGTASTYAPTATTLATSTLPAMLTVIEQLESDPPVYDYFVDDTPVIYGTSGADSASYFLAKVAQSPPKSNRLTCCRACQFP